jgi:hypothetical protein
VAVTVDQEVITESELRLEIRITAFLNGTAADYSAASRRAVAERLIEQLLMRREMRITRYPEPTAAEIAERLKAVRAQFKTEAEFRASLDRYGLTETQLRDALARQIAVLRFIDLRFRPEVQVLEPELLDYFYRVCAPEFRKRGGNANPSFDEMRAECEEMMVAGRVDERVEAWLTEARGRARIRYQEDALS